MIRSAGPLAAGEFEVQHLIATSDPSLRMGLRSFVPWECFGTARHQVWSSPSVQANWSVLKRTRSNSRMREIDDAAKPAPEHPPAADRRGLKTRCPKDCLA